MQINRNTQIQQLIHNFKNSSNPKQFLMRYIQSNPQVQNIYSILQMTNQSPKDLFYQLAKQKGIDPKVILDMLK